MGPAIPSQHRRVRGLKEGSTVTPSKCCQRVMTCGNCFMGEGGKRLQFFKIEMTDLEARLPKNSKLLDDNRE